ncbi:MAG: hypothetical protein HY985_01140 [Magnetospirillum sp.]|nr:hypothetical protein [Magnetospirillum sp.]
MRLTALGPRAAVAAVLAALALVWLVAVAGIGTQFHYSSNEITQLTLAHALNVDHWLGERIWRGRINTFNQYVYPGVPMQVLGWVALRVSDGWSFRGALDLARATLADPAPFFLVTRLLGLAMSAGAVVLLARHAKDQPWPAIAAALCAWLVYEPFWQYGLLYFDNPSFAALAAVLFFPAAFAALSGRATRGGWVLVGFLGMAGYSITLQYLSWLGAAGLGALAAAFLGRWGWRRTLAALGWTLLGMALAFELMALLMDGKFTHRAALKMLDFHFDIFQGTVDNTPVPAVSATEWTVMQSLHWWVAAYLVLALGMTGWMATLLVRWRRDRGLLAERAPAAVMLAVVFVFGALAFFKFPSDKYLMSSAATLPFGVLWLARCGQARPVGRLAAPLAVVALWAGATELMLEHQRKTFEREAQADREHILALPLAPGQKRLWLYRARTPEYNARLTLQWTGVREYDRLVGDHLFPFDSEYNVWRRAVRDGDRWLALDEVNWAYAVVQGRAGDLARQAPLHAFVGKVGSVEELQRMSVLVHGRAAP